MGLLPDLELQVVDVLQVVLAQALPSAAAPPLRGGRRGLVAGRRRCGLRDVHRHRRHRRPARSGGFFLRSRKGFGPDAEVWRVALLVGLGLGWLAVWCGRCFGFIGRGRRLRGEKVGRARRSVSHSKSEKTENTPDSEPVFSKMKNK